MEITQATFISSHAQLSKCPPPDRPEFAFIGRSNVGKSSLINMITGRKALAKTSVKPGKTQTINHFLINDAWYLVDLPGYGYAAVSKTAKSGWSKMIEDYIVNRETLTCLFVLLDSRLAPQAIDLSFIEWAGRSGVPICLIFTKSDKLSRNELAKSMKVYESTLLESWSELPPNVITSSANKTGRQEIIQFIEESLKADKKNY